MLLAAISVTAMLILGTLSIVGLVCDIEWMENLGNFGMAIIGGIAILPRWSYFGRGRSPSD